MPDDENKPDQPRKRPADKNFGGRREERPDRRGAAGSGRSSAAGPGSGRPRRDDRPQGDPRGAGRDDRSGGTGAAQARGRADGDRGRPAGGARGGSERWSADRPSGRSAQASESGDRRPRTSGGESGDRRPRTSGGESGDRRPQGKRPASGGYLPDRRTAGGGSASSRMASAPRQVNPGLERPADEPRLPDDFDEKVLPRTVRAELRGLPKELARTVAGHMIAAIDLIEDDPELAHRHAEAARRRAARLPVVRELAGETGYAAGDFASALNDFRAVRRMTGDDDYLPVMADCERALGRPKDALALAREAEALQLSPEQMIEMRLVEAGARDDLGQRSEALRVLKAAIADRRAPKEAQARLRFAYAELVLASGDEAEARHWFDAAARLDPDGALGARDRLAELDGRPPAQVPDEDDDQDFEVFEVEEDQQ